MDVDVGVNISGGTATFYINGAEIEVRSRDEAEKWKNAIDAVFRAVDWSGSIPQSETPEATPPAG